MFRLADEHTASRLRVPRTLVPYPDLRKGRPSLALAFTPIPTLALTLTLPASPNCSVTSGSARPSPTSTRHSARLAPFSPSTYPRKTHELLGTSPTQIFAAQACGSSLRLKLAGQPRAARDYAPRARRSLLLAAPCRSLLPACCCLHALTSPLFELRVWKANRWLLPGQPTLRATDSAGRSSACRGAPNAGGGSRPGQLALTISPHLSIYISPPSHTVHPPPVAAAIAAIATAATADDDSFRAQNIAENTDVERLSTRTHRHRNVALVLQRPLSRTCCCSLRASAPPALTRCLASASRALLLPLCQTAMPSVFFAP